MMKELKAGDTVVVFKLDRLGRSVLQPADLLVRFQLQEIHFCSLSEGIRNRIGTEIKGTAPTALSGLNEDSGRSAATLHSARQTN